MGYSMGGSGSFALANAYYDSKNQLFAAIVRMAGQSQSVVRDAIADRTSIWYHVGLSDEPVRIKIARETYNFFKGYPGNSLATETTEAVDIPGYTGTTLTLIKDGIEVVKYTEYNAPAAHGINNFPLSDPNLLKWLFNQSLIKRQDDRKKE
jgi:predicted peptidase